ncbi:protein kinase domain protein [Aspergillus flavus]|nr:uncharacterized protein G4B84_011531 [Aspergillus flavus NRRL3357]KAJ1715029.1 protein kinase domain protein [Aspergillus flavus]QMW36002.1 hypothetical protein G4B84_011531 [Aspergillus flavus NRRL3357]QMW48063.1 hypothetical protein G4B11_011581 [Aspergillus flavus]RAQ66030.1 protein kinase domain protein [Aspergillus flavus]RAQ77051.1 protein kinase domain protein [Aspergillus flavus]
MSSRCINALTERQNAQVARPSGLYVTLSILMGPKVTINVSFILHYSRVYGSSSTVTPSKGCLNSPGLYALAGVSSARLPAHRVPDYTYCLDIKANNIMFELADDSVFIKSEDDELQNPSPRKELDVRAIYLSRELEILPGKIDAPVLCDFGSATLGSIEHSEDVQPDIYRAPEIWNIFEGGSLFTGHDPEFKAYRSRAHLAEMINLLGPPPPSLLARGKQTHRFFSDTGEFREATLLQNMTPLDQRETTLEGEDKESFLRMMRRKLQWEPEKRSSAQELAEDEWICRQID